MNPDILEFAREWLQLAGDDLKWAKVSFREGFYSQTCFVCQQVAEKSLKGYLYAFRRDAKTHGLVRLMELCLEFDSAFLSLKKDLRILEPYYIGTRYPDVGDVARFNKEGFAKEALQIAEKVLNFVDGKLEK